MTHLFHDTKRNLLVYQTAQPERITQHIPQARRINGSEFVAVPNSLSNIQILRLLQLPVVCPMAAYDWPTSSGDNLAPAKRRWQTLWSLICGASISPTL
jgi:hypothetical protein